MTAPPATTMTARPSPESFTAPARDGYVIHGTRWLHPRSERAPVVVINAATSVHSRYYARYAAWLHARGRDVYTYDYRGIGLSRPATGLRGLDASWTDWGALDCDAVLRQVAHRHDDVPVDVVAHSFGGCALGLAANAARVRHVVTVAAQYAYWRDYAPRQRHAMWWRWHVLMPLLTRLCGYFPGKRLGWLEDTPAGVVRDWSSARPDYRQRPSMRTSPPAVAFSHLRARMLAIGLEDDPFGTEAALDRLLAHYGQCARTQLRIAPADIGAPAIGHFALFHERHAASLWPLTLTWLEQGRLPAGHVGRVSPASA